MIILEAIRMDQDQTLMNQTTNQKFATKDIIKVKLESIAFGGEAVGRLEGLVVFARGGIDGETVLVEIDEVKKSFLKGHVVQVLEPSEHRLLAPCSIYGQCGGCQYQHIHYQHQIQIKEQQVQECFERIGHLKDYSLLPMIPSHAPYGYRSRVDFHIRDDEQGLRIGFVAHNSRKVLEVSNCLISTPGINQSLQQMKTDIRAGRFVIPEWAEVVKFWDTLKGIEYFFLNTRGQVDLRGIDFNWIEVCGKKFKVPPLSFFQVNIPTIEYLAKTVEEFLELSGQEYLMDGYCGVGLFALLLAPKTKYCFGIEADPSAVQFARINAEENGIKNCEFLDKSMGKILKHPERYLKKSFSETGESVYPDRVILDPTRAGCEPSELESLVKLKVPRIVYVSCHPATLARDLGLLTQRGYRLQKVQPIDLFPQTQHFETVASLTRE